MGYLTTVQTYNAGAITQTVVVPASVQEGDVCFLFPMIDNSVGGSWTVAGSGWNTLQAAQAATNMMWAAFWKRMVAADLGSTISVTGSSNYANLVAVWYRGISDPQVVGTVGIRSGSIFTVTAPSITTTKDKELIITFAADRSIAASAAEQGNPSFPTSTMRIYTTGDPTLNAATAICQLAVADRYLTTAGASGAEQVTFGDSSANAFGFQIAVDEAMRVYDGTKTAGRLFVTTSTAGGAASVKPVISLTKT